MFIRLRLWLDTDLIVVLHHHQCQTTLFKLQPGDFGPELHTETDVTKKKTVFVPNGSEVHLEQTHVLKNVE